jgi:hypothetical protein
MTLRGAMMDADARLMPGPGAGRIVAKLHERLAERSLI